MFSPLEQFSLLLLIQSSSVSIFWTTETLALLFMTFRLLLTLSNLILSKTLVPYPDMIVAESFYLFISDLMQKNIKTLAFQHYFLIVFNLFFFIFFANVLGLIPYTYSLTSQLILTSMFSVSLMIGITILGIRLHGDNFLSLFIPNGISIFLAPMLVAIELISYVFRALSLAIRLFANMMAGHTLLKIISTFTWLALCSPSAFISLAGVLGVGLLTMLVFLECGVAIIQSYVFTILICLYLNDVINLH